jgi:hypothetical protein
MWKYALAIGVVSYFIHRICEKKRIKRDGNDFGINQIPLENIAATFCLGAVFSFIISIPLTISYIGWEGGKFRSVYNWWWGL